MCQCGSSDACGFVAAYVIRSRALPRYPTQSQEYDEDYFEATWRLSQQHRLTKEAIQTVLSGLVKEIRGGPAEAAEGTSLLLA